MTNIVKDTRARLRALTGRVVSQADIGLALGLSDKNASRTVRRWEDDSPTGPAKVALTYMCQGLLDDDMKQIVPEFVAGGAVGDGDASGDYVIRLWWPRFLGMVVPADASIEGDWAWLAEDVEKLAVMMWIDDPAMAPDRMEYVRRAASLLEIETQDASEEFGK